MPLLPRHRFSELSDADEAGLECCSLNKDEFRARRNWLNVDDLSPVLRLFAALRHSARVQPNFIRQTLRSRVPVTSQLFFLFLPLWRTTWLCFTLFYPSSIFHISPGECSVITCLLPFGASPDLSVWTDLLLQRKLGSNQRRRPSERFKLRLSKCRRRRCEGKHLCVASDDILKNICLKIDRLKGAGSQNN